MAGAAVSRRALLGGLGVGGVGAAVGAVGAGAWKASADTAAPTPHAGTVPFHGEHQAGIATEAQDRLAFASFDVVSTDRADLRDLMREWTAAAASMTRGLPVPGSSSVLEAPPADTGETEGMPPGLLTVTAGFGPSLFDDRFGLARRRPARLRDLPALPGDGLDPDRSGGDLAIQACAQDPQVAFHVIRNLARIGRGVVQMRWSQLGFGRTSATSSTQSTPRNLMGFKDGTRNVRGDDAARMRDHVWVPSNADQGWMAGGSYLVARRIRMRIEGWDRDPLGAQQEVFGRDKLEGAPLTGTREGDVPDYAAKAADGTPVIARNAHIRLAAPENNGGRAMLRRGYSFTDGVDPASGELDAGLFFLAFMRDPQVFVDLQNKLGSLDALNEYIEHVGSGLFACPGGVRDEKDYWGRGLLA
jgi:deferrochelatase/peroxidase EfeB